MAQHSCLQPGQPVEATDPTSRDRRLAPDQPSAEVGEAGGRLVKHARYYWLLLAEGHLTRVRFSAMLRRIALLPLPAN